MSLPVVDFLGEVYRPRPGAPFLIGRDADLIVDADNPFLHRRLLALAEHDGLWWLSNVGGRLAATLADAAGVLQAQLAPGASLPLASACTRVWFTAGPTTYELEIRLPRAPLTAAPALPDADGSRTLGPAALTPAQKLLVLALCEDALRRGERGRSAIPTSASAARRLGWPLTRFNRKLDNVCEKLAAAGVSGLHGGPDRLAATRKARLVEYALAARLVVPEDLPLLDAPAT